MALWWSVGFLAVAAAIGMTVTVRRRRRRRPLTRSEHVRSARSAMKDLNAANRRVRRRPYLGRSETANRRDRYSAAIGENAIYGDASGYGGGDSGGGGGGSD